MKIESAFKAIDVNESGSIELDDLEKELKNYHQIEDKE
jgi:Ca2+-binding EF-hand superfamily protein